MSLSIVDKLNALSVEMESLLDFIASNSKLGEGTTMCFVIRKYQEVPVYE